MVAISAKIAKQTKVDFSATDKNILKPIMAFSSTIRCNSFIGSYCLNISMASEKLPCSQFVVQILRSCTEHSKRVFQLAEPLRKIMSDMVTSWTRRKLNEIQTIKRKIR